MQKKNIYGYAVGYRELGSRFIRYFTTLTYRSAQQSLRIYQKYPQRERKSNRPLMNPVWEIQPITKKEVLRAILDEIPFLRRWITTFYLDFYHYSRKIFHFFMQQQKFLSILRLSLSFVRWGYRRIGVTQK